MVSLKIAAAVLAAFLVGVFVSGNLSLVRETFFDNDGFVEEIPLRASVSRAGSSNKPTTEKQKMATTQPRADGRKIATCFFIPSRDIDMSKFLPGPVIFNEIAWMGGPASAQNEWIELKNIQSKTGEPSTGELSIDISGWQILDKDEQIKFVFPKNTKIEAGGFYLLARVENAEISKFQNLEMSKHPDATYAGNLKNSDEGLRLFDADCNLVDEVFANPAWPAGDNEAKKTMERGADLKWFTSSRIGGTPKAENSVLNFEIFKSLNIEKPAASSTATTSSMPINQSPTDQPPTDQPPTNQSIVSPAPSANPKILFSEIFYDAEGSDAGKEFIELYNAGPATAELSGWSLTLNGESLVKFGAKSDDAVAIKSGGYLLVGFNNYAASPSADVKRSASLPNTAATISLVDKEGILRDSASYNNSVSPGQSWERVSWESNQFRVQSSPSPKNSSQ